MSTRHRGRGFHVRAVRAEDSPALYALDQQCFPPEIAYSPDDLRYFLEAKDSLTLVAEADGAAGIAGFTLAQMYRARPTFQARLITIDVAPEFRRKGIGSALLKACEAELRSRHVTRFRLEVAVGNSAAQALYKSFGYETVGGISAYYPTGEDALVMQKQL
jgi:ribosomal-protein-alanine N-acetyltransferase